MTRVLVLSTLISLTAFASFGAGAQTTLHFREGQRVDPDAVMQILDNVDGRRTRSIRLLNDDPAVPATTVQTSASALSLPVHFAFDSAAILPEARAQLDALADGIKRLPTDRLVVIEGHADARGDTAYNQQLSQRRAEAVKQYLVDQHGIEAQRLRDKGLGQRQPIPGTDPYAPENRRVQFRGA